jgi:hypothetical protein
MKKLIYFTLLIPVLIFGQSKSEKIIADFQKMSRESGIYIQSPNVKPEPVFQFCEKWNNKISKLDKLMSDDELESLKASNNGTLKFISYLISAKRNNNKEFILGLLDSITNEKKIFMAWGCDRNESSFSYQMYLLRVLSVKNNLFKPNNDLTQSEFDAILNKIKNIK